MALQTGQFQLTLTPTELVPTRAKTVFVVIHGCKNAVSFIGKSTVDEETGFGLPASGEAVELELAPNDTLYGMSSHPNARVWVLVSTGEF